MAISVLEALARRLPFRLGEVEVRPEGEKGWVVAGPPRDEWREVPATEAAVRTVVRFDDRGRYRPLSGARGMPGGWRVRCADTTVLERVLDALYPLALVHLREHEAGTLRLVALDEVLARQSGRYEVARQLSPEGRALAVSTVCGQCVRFPAWAGQAAPEGTNIPCPEPCSVLVSFCREAALWEAEQVTPGDDDPTVAFADFEAEGNALRNAYLRARTTIARGQR